MPARRGIAFKEAALLCAAPECAHLLTLPSLTLLLSLLLTLPSVPSLPPPAPSPPARRRRRRAAAARAVAAAAAAAPSRVCTLVRAGGGGGPPQWLSGSWRVYCGGMPRSVRLGATSRLRSGDL